MDQDLLTMTLHLVGAMAVGGAIGLERSYHGRPAGFRTHTLVCLASSLTVGTLSLFRLIEARIPSHHYAQHFISFDRSDAMEDEDIRSMLEQHGFTIANISYRVSESGADFEYRMVIRTSTPDRFSSLANYLRSHQRVKTFRISPTGD